MDKSLPVDPYGLYKKTFVNGAHPKRLVQAPSFGNIYGDDMRIPEKVIGGKRDPQFKNQILLENSAIFKNQAGNVIKYLHKLVNNDPEAYKTLLKIS